MTAKKHSPGFDFVVAQLEANADVDYATVRKAAEARGFTIYPIMYGRAKAKLGLVPVAPRGSRKRAKQNGLNGAVGSVESVIAAMKNGEEERQRYRDALEQIADIIQRALRAPA